MFFQTCGNNLQEKVKFCAKCGTTTLKAQNIADDSSIVETRSNDAIAIWNPNAASNWSIIFSPVFGSFIQALNWKSLGEDERASSAMRWFYFNLMILLVLVLIGVFSPDPETAESLGYSLGFLHLFIWYLCVGKSQAKYVKEKYGTDYVHKGWGKPLLIRVLGKICFLIIAMVIGFIIGKTLGLS